MENEKIELNIKQAKKLNEYYLLVVIISVLVLVCGVSLGLYANVASEDKDTTRLSTGTLTASFVDGININSPLLIPRYEPVSSTDIVNAYKNEFTVENTGTLDQTFTISLDIEKNEFVSGNLKFIVFNENNVKVNSGSIMGTNSLDIIKNTYLKSGNISKYTLIIWIAETGTSQNIDQDRNINASMSLMAVQIR